MSASDMSVTQNSFDNRLEGNLSSNVDSAQKKMSHLSVADFNVHNMITIVRVAPKLPEEQKPTGSIPEEGKVK